MEASQWGARAFRRAEAARACGLPEGTLGVLIHRMRDCEALFTERQNGRRVFSLRDLSVLATAFAIERAGRTWLDALSIAFNFTDEPPAPDDVLVMTAAPVRASGGPKRMHRSAVPPVERDAIVIVPIGAIVAEILARTGARP